MNPDRIPLTRWLAAPLAAFLALAVVSAPADAKKKDKKDEKPAATAPAKGDEKPFDEVVKDMEVHEGLFRVYTKADENKMLVEILPGQLDQMFLFSPTLDQALGERGFYSSMVMQEFPTVFRRVGKNIQWVQKNTLYKADEGTPEHRAASRSFADAILANAKIAAKPHPERNSLLVDAADLFNSDLPGVGRALGMTYNRTMYRFDKAASGPIAVHAFPQNVLFDVRLHYTTDDPKSYSVTLPDPRSVPMVVKYDLSPLVRSDYKPRLADDRIGHFHTVQQDFRSDHDASPYLRYITRWRLEKADPAAALSAPKEPIVYWLENTIPVEYRQAITDGTLLWNKAFEKIGFKDAIVVKQQPDSADWDPADRRYNTIRWFAGVDATFAIGPSRIDPYTGQIYDADIGISEGIIRNARRAAEELVAPSSPTASNWLGDDWGRNMKHTFCTYGSGLAEQAAFGASVMAARGDYSPELEKRMMYEYVLELTAHEVGHTLGLRHNFRGTAILAANELHDQKRTHEVGQSASVMDYNPIVIAAKGETQGDFLPITLGPYDYWAIEYAYKPVEGDEREALNAIASRAASDPMLPYSTDEDAYGTYSPRSIDPFANQYDQSSDPLAYFGKRIEIIEELWHSLDNGLAKPGEGYQILRRSLGRGLNEYNRAILTSSKMVGGVYHYRDHVGDPGGRPPFVPVPAAKQREALSFIAEHAFGAKAFQLPPTVLNRLAIERLPSLDPGYYGVARLDYPWHDAVLGLQRRVMARLYDPITLGRVLDNEMRFAAGEAPFRMVDLFGGVSNAVWSELDSPPAGISSLRRNLQREHVRQLVAMLLRHQPDVPEGVVVAPLPDDATTLARASLSRIRERIKSALASSAFTDLTSRVHLQETDARIAAAFNAEVGMGLH
jgi:hypothetical protein